MKITEAHIKKAVEITTLIEKQSPEVLACLADLVTLQEGEMPQCENIEEAIIEKCAYEGYPKGKSTPTTVHGIILLPVFAINITVDKKKKETSWKFHND